MKYISSKKYRQCRLMTVVACNLPFSGPRGIGKTGGCKSEGHKKLRNSVYKNEF